MADGKAQIAAAVDGRFRKGGWTLIGTAYLCKGDGTGTLIANDAARLVWLHRNDNSAPFTAYLPAPTFVDFVDGDSSLEAIEVRIGYPEDSNVLTVKDAMTSGGRAAIGSQSPAEATLAATYWAELQRLVNLRAAPSDPVSTSVAISGPLVYIKPSDSSIQLFASGTLSLAADIAALASGKHQLGILYLDKVTGALGRIVATAATAAGTLPSRDEFAFSNVQALWTASGSADYTPIIPFYLYYGQTVVNEADFYRSWDLRPLFGGGAAGAAYYQTVQAGGIDVAQRSKLNFVASSNIGISFGDSASPSVTTVTISGADPVTDITGQAGENVSARDICYLNPSDNKWYKVDIDATAAVKVGKFRALVTANVSADATGTFRLAGRLTGFSGLTPGADVYASTTAGGYTQTKPTVSAAGGQRAIVRVGFALESGAIFIEHAPVQFLKRESLANTAALTLEHYADALGRERRVRAYISTTTGGTLTENTSPNHDQGVPLRGGTGSGSTTTPYSGTADGQGIGEVSAGQDWWWGQSFQITAGTLTQFTFNLRANTGTPTGTMTWEIRSDSAGAPGSVLATGTLTPTASATNTVAVPDGLFLAASTTYWLVLHSTNVQSTGNYWSWYSSTSSAYASGNASLSSNGGSSWSAQPTVDMACSITTVATTPFDRLAQSFQIGSNSNCDYVTLYLRKFGSPTGTMTLRIETNSGGAASGTLVDANATITVAESGLTTSFSNVTFNFTDFALSSGTTYWLVLSTDRTASASDYVVWGVDASSPSYANGNFSTYASSAYTADSTRDAIFSVVGPTTTYEEPCVVGRESGGTRDVSCRYDDGAGANGDTQTTFTNRIGSSADITAVVELM